MVGAHAKILNAQIRFEPGVEQHQPRHICRRNSIAMNPSEMLKTRPKAQIDEFQPGDTVTVNMVIREGDRTRVQAFQGNVIVGQYRNDKIPNPGSTFKVRRVSYGIGVERIVPYPSPLLESVKVTRHGKVRRSRLYYLRGLTGRHARIKERR